MVDRSFALSLDDVLDKVGTLFAARGFEGTSFRDITAVTGAKRPLLLYHFGTKEDLWRRAMLRIVARLNAAMAMRPLPPTDRPDRERMAELLRAYLDTLREVPEFGRILVREGVSAGPRLDWLVANFVPAFAKEFILADRTAVQRVRSSMLRDIVIAAPLFATALGPLLEGSMAAASRAPSAGIYPMSNARRDELVLLLTDLILDHAGSNKGPTTPVSAAG